MAKKGTMEEIRNLFEEFETKFICVTDFGIVVNGTRLDYLCYNHETKKVELWSGNPIDMDDKYAEEVLISKKEKYNVFREILKYI